MTGDSAAESLGRRLSEWRRQQRLSLTAAGRRLGVHPTTYQRWEEGRRPYPRHLRTIAELLRDDVSAVTALAGPAPQRPGRPAPQDASVLMRARLAVRLNRMELGRRLHVGPAAVYRWERGRTRPPEQLLPRLAGQLRLTREELEAALAEHPPYRLDGEVLPGLGATLRRHDWDRGRVRSLLQMSPSTVFEWETGRTRVPMWALRRIAAALDLTVDDLTADARQRSRGSPARTTLATLRRRHGMTQREAAAVLGVSASSLGRYETGRRRIGLPLARTMARTYRVPLTLVLATAGLTPPPILETPQWSHRQLPEVLGDLRQFAGVSMSHVARCAGVSHPTVRRWETGESTPSSGALVTLELRYQLSRGRLTSLG